MSYLGKVKKFINQHLSEKTIPLPYWRQWFLGVLVFLTLVVILLANLSPRQVNLQLGEVSTRDIEAPRTIVDRVRTEELQEDAVSRDIRALKDNPGNYVINREEAGIAQEQIEKTFTYFINTARENAGVANIPAETVSAVQSAIRRDYGVVISAKSVQTAITTTADTLDVLRNISQKIAASILLSRQISTGDLDEAKKQVSREADAREVTWRYRSLVVETVQSVIRPNLVLDPDKVQQVEENARRSVTPVRILKGQAIVRRGDVITEEHLRVLRELGLQAASTNYMARLGFILLCALFLTILGVYLFEFEKNILKHESLLALLGLIIVLVVFAGKVLTTIPWEGSGYLIPVAFGMMVITIMLNSRLAVVATLVTSLLIGLVGGGEFEVLLLSLIGGLVAVFSVSRVSQRGDLMRAGGLVGVALFLTIVAYSFFTSEPGLLKSSYLGLVNGIVSSIFTIGSLPYLESLFGVTSAIRLLEISNPTHPLLKRLLLEAPGTYHHSIMVGNLAEAAAEAVHADNLLARVGAYYHDVGKVKRPYFFVENQVTGENPHDRLTPHLSTLIITSHVRDGVELGREYGLPEVVQDFIRQHHGEDLVRYFYYRATENGKDDSVPEEDFRYDGPRPQTKETAIVMLADSVEAAVRSLEKSTPAKVEALVKRIISERLNDGQLDESDLTLKDLDRIGQAFVRVLSGVFHARIEYPEKVLKEMEQRGGHRQERNGQS